MAGTNTVVKGQNALELQYEKVLNPSSFKDYKKTQFKEEFKGKLPFDLNGAWEWIVKNRK